MMNTIAQASPQKIELIFLSPPKVAALLEYIKKIKLSIFLQN